MFPFAHCYVRRPKKVSDCLTKKVKMESQSLCDIQMKGNMDDLTFIYFLTYKSCTYLIYVT